MAPTPNTTAPSAARGAHRAVEAKGRILVVDDETNARSALTELLRDFREGFPGTSVKAGVLGEIGTSEPLTLTEQVVLRAAA